MGPHSDISEAKLTAATTTIDAGGTLIGCGTINGAVVNNGTVLSECGGVLTISGNVTNNGTLRITNGGNARCIRDLYQQRHPRHHDRGAGSSGAFCQ
jgi:hypothetical protein